MPHLFRLLVASFAMSLALLSFLCLFLVLVSSLSISPPSCARSEGTGHIVVSPGGFLATIYYHAAAVVPEVRCFSAILCLGAHEPRLVEMFAML